MNNKELILSKKVAEIRKGAKNLQKNKDPNLELETVDVLKKQLIKNNSWETVVELVKAVGENNYKSSLPLIKNIVNKNEEYDTITVFASKSFVQLSRIDLTDICPILEYINDCKYSLGYGFMDSLGYDRMVPRNNDIEFLLNRFWKFYELRESGLSDPRYGLAAACAGWEVDIVKPFLEYCLLTGDVPLKYVAENSLKNKYVKLR